MSDLYILCDEAFEETTIEGRIGKIKEICTRWNLSFLQATNIYYDYINSDQFKQEHGI